MLLSSVNYRPSSIVFLEAFMARHEDEEYVVVEKGGSSVAPFFWGLAVGAGLALLFAPMSGAELRDEIKNRGLRLKELAEDKAEEIEDYISDRYGRARDKVEEGIETTKKKAREGKQFAH